MMNALWVFFLGFQPEKEREKEGGTREGRRGKGSIEREIEKAKCER